MKQKGISPIIATVLLIAVTMAIAGMMATWAQNFIGNRMSDVEENSSSLCTGLINLDARIYNGQGYAIVEVVSSTAGLTEWKGTIAYNQPPFTQNVSFTDSSIVLRTGDTWTFNFTNSSASPQTLKISSGSCPGVSVTGGIKVTG